MSVYSGSQIKTNETDLV